MDEELHLNLDDEWANSLTHGIGLALSMVGFIFLITIPLINGHLWKILPFSIYGISLVSLYTASTLYHSFRTLSLKRLFRLLDHCAIYLLIAGSYTPFTLVAMQGTWGWALFGVIWSLALIGIIFKIFFVGRFKLISTGIYLVMGWMILVALEPLLNSISYDAFLWIIAGGLFYTVGVIFFLLDHIRFYHAIWHLFVMGGSLCHYLAILFHI